MTTFSNESLGLSGTTACGDGDTHQFHFVEAAGTAKRVSIATGASGPAPIGVMQNDPRSGEAANVIYVGGTQVYADGSTAIVYGDFITSGSDGQAVKASGSTVHGQALEALASGASVLIEAVLFGVGQSAIIENTP